MKKIHTLFNKLHQTNPKIGAKLSLATASIAIIGNSVVHGAPLWLIGTIKVAIGSKTADKIVVSNSKKWVDFNNHLVDTITPTKDWRITLPEDLSPDKKYLLVCNHQSWVDTSITQYVSHSKKISPNLPFTRFFSKFELIYIPIIGQVFYFLDFPMMKRHSKAEIEKNPALKDKDIIEAKRACKLLKDKPFTLLNYIEGTRFSRAKHSYQKSPYSHLLKPKAGGLSLAISALGDDIDGILDMTVVYPDFKSEPPNYSDLWKGNIKHLGVEIRHLKMPDELFQNIKEGGYHTNEKTKSDMFAWLDNLWEDKDKQIDRMLSEFN